MIEIKTETPSPNMLEYEARHGTKFCMHKKGGELGVKKPALIPDCHFVEDCVEFGGWHGSTIFPDLATFDGYDSLYVQFYKA